jgi:hypothetical protein
MKNRSTLKMILSIAHIYVIPFYKSVFVKTSETKFEKITVREDEGSGCAIFLRVCNSTQSLSLYARRSRRITIEISLCFSPY